MQETGDIEGAVLTTHYGVWFNGHLFNPATCVLVPR
jgi:hypothetical protein